MPLSRSALLLWGALLTAVACESPVDPPAAETRLLIARGAADGADLYSILPDGSGAVQITSDPGGEYCGRWSPDRQRIAYVASRDSVWTGDEWARTPGVYVMRADGSQSVKLAGIDRVSVMGCPDWSPDGSSILYDRHSREAGGRALFILRVDGGGETRLVTTGRNSFSGQWSPDGSTIAYLRDDAYSAGIYLINADGSNRRKLPTPCLGEVFEPAWAPDGARLAFTCEFTNGWELFTVRLDGTDPVRVDPPLGNALGSDRYPVWSPDGRRIAISRIHEGTGADLFIVSSTGGAGVRIPQTDRNDVASDWR